MINIFTDSSDDLWEIVVVSVDISGNSGKCVWYLDNSAGFCSRASSNASNTDFFFSFLLRPSHLLSFHPMVHCGTGSGLASIRLYRVLRKISLIRLSLSCIKFDCSKLETACGHICMYYTHKSHNTGILYTYVEFYKTFIMIDIIHYTSINDWYYS